MASFLQMTALTCTIWVGSYSPRESTLHCTTHKVVDVEKYHPETKTDWTGIEMFNLPTERSDVEDGP